MELPKASGVYAIEHIPTKRFYIGSSKTLNSRIKAHLHSLRNGKHSNSKLQRSWNAHSESEFRCFVLELCEAEARIEREREWMETLQPYYNIAPVAGTTEGFKFSVESRMKLARSRGLITFGGEDGFETLSDVAARHRIPLARLWRRIKHQGMSLEDAITKEHDRSASVGKGWAAMSPEARKRRGRNISAALRGKENTKRRKKYMFRGEMLTLQEIADRFSIPFKRLSMRIHGGVDLELAVRCGNLEHLRDDPEHAAKLNDIVRESVRNRKQPIMSPDGRERQRRAVIEYNKTRHVSVETRQRMRDARRNSEGTERFKLSNETLTVLEMAERFGIDRHVLRKRLNAGWSVEDAVTRKVTPKPRRKA